MQIGFVNLSGNCFHVKHNLEKQNPALYRLFLLAISSESYTMTKTSKTTIKNTNKLIIQGQEFEMSIQDLKQLRDAIDEIIGEKIKFVPIHPPVIFPDRKEPIDDSDYPKPYPKITPYKPWRTEDEIYPIWCQEDYPSRDKVTVTM